jgi:nicotinate-nucleotide adenylyltransferase
MKQGFLGGTFDPIHQGHLDVADAARAALGLDCVTFVPASLPSHRNAPVASAAHRFAMVAIAISAVPYFSISDLEMDGTSPAYTVNSLNRLAARGEDLRDWFVLTGADAFADIRTWKSYPDVLSRCHFAVVSRPGRPVSQLADLLPELANRMQPAADGIPEEPAILLIDAPTADVSASEVRLRAARGDSLNGMVPPAVAAHIQKHQLYAPKGHA